jgi:tetratricopeptide (TPR) repeat protein
MRKLVLSVLLAASFMGLYAQKLDDVKDKIAKKKWDEAKEKIDKVFEDQKAQTNSDAWFYKAQIYQNLAKVNPADVTYASTAFEAIKQYFQLEQKQPETKRFLLTTLEGNKTVFDVYSDYFKAGADAYNQKDYQKALNNFEKTIEAFEFLKNNKLTTATFDTTSVLYAGVSAEQMKNKELAIKYYSQLADLKVPDTTFLGIYEYVVNYYTLGKDEGNARKYLTIGEEVFPEYDRWLMYEVELVGNDKAKKLQKYGELVQRYPDNAELWIDYAVMFFNHTYSNETKPADYSGRQDTLAQILQKAIAAEQSPLANYLMTRHVNNQIADLEEQKRAVKGTTPADVAKKKDFDVKIEAKYDEMVVYSQKAFDLYSQIADIKGVEKIYYKEVTRDLADYYNLKKNTAKATEFQNKLKQLQ